MKPVLLVPLAFLFLSSSLFAADAKRGEELHNKHCSDCHINMTGGDGSTLYTRSARRVTSLPQLHTQVRRCENNLGLQWWDEDVADVVQHLNNSYYRFADK